MKWPTFESVSDPSVRRYLSSRLNWVGMLAAAVMFSVMWPNLAMSHEVAIYLLPFLSAAGSLPLAMVFAGPAAVRTGWAMVAVVGSACSLLPHPGIDFPMPIPMFLVLFVMTIAALMTQSLSRLPVVTILTSGAITLGVQPGARMGWIVSLVVVAFTIAFIRYRLTSQQQIAHQTEQTHDAQEREAVLAERTRIARELHDVVAHRMSMVVVMSQTAKYRLAAGNPPETVGPATDAEFAAIADAARQSLDEVRQLLGVLRPVDGGGEASLRPVHGVADLPALVESVRAAGVSVDFTDGTADWGGPGAAGAAVYRIVQESLTNAARHAPGSPVEVSLRNTADGLVIVSIVNGPAAESVEADADARPGGHGIAGMRERAAAVGGDLVAEPTADGGFAVTARISRADALPGV